MAPKIQYERPTLYVTDWASRHLHGPGRRYAIMARPWGQEHGDGRVPSLTPRLEWLDELREGFLSLRAFELLCREEFALPPEPGWLAAVDVSNGYGDNERLVEDGDTLCCDCSRAVAALGFCHRVWAAEALVAAGWRVVLDGKELSQGQRPSEASVPFSAAPTALSRTGEVLAKFGCPWSN